MCNPMHTLFYANMSSEAHSVREDNNPTDNQPKTKKKESEREVRWQKYGMHPQFLPFVALPPSHSHFLALKWEQERNSVRTRISDSNSVYATDSLFGHVVMLWVVLWWAKDGWREH